MRRTHAHLATGLCLAMLAGCAGEAPGRRPDVLLIVIDTLRADHLGSYGHPAPTSPRIDALAADGAVFEHVVAASALTAPSVAAILTGRYPRFNSFGLGNRGYRLDASEQTLAERFRAAGYRTAAFVGNPMLHARTGFDQGFEVYDARMPQHEQVRAARERVARSTTDAALGWLASLGPDESAFLWLHFMDPHGPYTPPEAFRERFAVEPGGRTIAPPPRKGANSGKGFVPWYQAVREVHRFDEYVGRYDAEIAYTDEQLGRLLDWLGEHGRYDGAVVLLTSDHGEALGENDYYFAHGHSVTRDQSAVPLILKHPAHAPGSRVADPVGHVDIFATLTALLGAEVRPNGFEGGIDLASLPAAASPERALFSDLGFQLAVHLGDHLLLGNVDWEPGGSSGPDDFATLALVDYVAAPWLRVGDPAARRRLEERARAYLAAPAARVSRLEEEPPELEAQLRALGYLEE